MRYFFSSMMIQIALVALAVPLAIFWMLSSSPGITLHDGTTPDDKLPVHRAMTSQSIATARISPTGLDRTIFVGSPKLPDFEIRRGSLGSGPNEEPPARSWHSDARPPSWLPMIQVAGDGAIRLEEWRAAGQSAAYFRQLDRDGDGLLTQTEMLAAVGRNLDQDHSNSLMPNSPAQITVSARANLTAASAAVVPTKPVTRFDNDALATMPLPLDDGFSPYWTMRNQQNRDFVAVGGQARVLFLGDSITDLLSSGTGQPLWDKYIAPLGSVNFAVGGAMTSQVLWQIETGQVQAVNPQIIVLLIGSNNLAVGQSPVATANGITKTVNELQKRLPRTKILLLALLPRAQNADNPIRNKILAVNRMISSLNDGQSLRFVDFSARFLGTEGALSPQIMPDFLHPSFQGYQIYLTAIWPTLTEMLED